MSSVSSKAAKIELVVANNDARYPLKTILHNALAFRAFHCADHLLSLEKEKTVSGMAGGMACGSRARESSHRIPAEHGIHLFLGSML